MVDRQSRMSAVNVYVGRVGSDAVADVSLVAHALSSPGRKWLASEIGE